MNKDIKDINPDKYYICFRLFRDEPWRRMSKIEYDHPAISDREISDWRSDGGGNEDWRFQLKYAKSIKGSDIS